MYCQCVIFTHILVTEKYCHHVIFTENLVTDILSISFVIPIGWTPQELIDGKSTLIQVMAWCRQATSHYLNQCWPRSVSPCGVTRPRWVNVLATKISWMLYFNTLRLGQNWDRQHFQIHFLEWKYLNLDKNSSEHVLEGPIDNRST